MLSTSLIDVPGEEVEEGERILGQWWGITSRMCVINFEEFLEDHGRCHVRSNGQVHDILYRRAGVSPESLDWEEADRAYTESNHFNLTAANSEHKSDEINITWTR